MGIILSAIAILVSLASFIYTYRKDKRAESRAVHAEERAERAEELQRRADERAQRAELRLQDEERPIIEVWPVSLIRDSDEAKLVGIGTLYRHGKIPVTPVDFWILYKDADWVEYGFFDPRVTLSLTFPKHEYNLGLRSTDEPPIGCAIVDAQYKIHYSGEVPENKKHLTAKRMLGEFRRI